MRRRKMNQPVNSYQSSVNARRKVQFDEAARASRSFRNPKGMESLWSAELTTQAWFFTDNDDFFNGKQLGQDPPINNGR